MVNKLLVTSTKRNKMRPKRARARQHNRLPRFCWQYRICRVLIKNRAGFRSCHHLRYKVWRKSTLFVSIISISKEYNITHYKIAWTCNRMRATSDRHQRPSMWLRLWLHQEPGLHHSIRHFGSTANSKARWQKNFRIREKIVYTTKNLRIQNFTSSKLPLKIPDSKSLET